VNKSAILSACGAFRYELTREWDRDLPTIGFIMLNPSTADASNDDPTIKKCIKFAVRWGYGRLLVGNLYGYRATDPRALRSSVDPVGPENDVSLIRIITASEKIVCGWGVNAVDDWRGPAVKSLIKRFGLPPQALRITKDGHPGHPLYIRDDTPLVDYP
jgi:hypothetical protein